MVSGIDFIDLGYLVASALFIFGLKTSAIRGPLPVGICTAPWGC